MVRIRLISFHKYLYDEKRIVEAARILGGIQEPRSRAVSGNQILLRAERAGTGNGRVYQVHFTATDDQGGSCSGSVKVGVPHSKKDPALEGAQLYNSFGP